ncbi:MAG: efflux RND transporter permease subunit, partial [Candidatus Sericytochromatia bacterium]
MEELLAKLIKHKLGIIAFFVFLIGIGVKSFQELPIDAFPDLTNNQIAIMTTGEGMAPGEIEQLI